MKKALCIFLSLILLCAVFLPPVVSAEEANSVFVEPIDFQRPDFIRGMDVSSVIALEKSGVVFRDSSGKAEDLFAILAENGVNYIRVRVWNDPFDAEGNGYGGGNNDVAAAALIGRRAARFGMKLLVDFHYSDFWADPGKQTAPKAWGDMSLKQKKTAVTAFTAESLRTIRDAGADIGMVQIGNETTTGIAGEYDWQNMVQIFSAGSAAVRAFDPDVLVAIHFTNPENSYIKDLADHLNDYAVDYDVFATSYYPCWHGSLSNLKAVLNYAAETYGKYTMVAETSYPYTLDDSDGHPNTVSADKNSSGANMLWSFSAQGQADAVSSIMQTVNSVTGGKGLGVFYWEGAWITVGDTTGLSGTAYTAQVRQNKSLWKRDGSGWATPYSGEYDPDGGRWYGGSAVDNQAFFSPDGTALPSLSVFRAVLPEGAYRLGDADGSETVGITDATVLQRCCAKMETNVPSSTLLHGDADKSDSLNVIDVTLIQRYTAKMDTPYPIGVWMQAS